MQNKSVSVKITTKSQNSSAYHKGYTMMLCICLISTKKAPFYLHHEETKTPQTILCLHWNPNWASLALLNMPQLCDLLSHEKTGTAVSPLLVQVFFPTAVFLLSRKWKQVNSLYSVDIAQAFFQNVDESFSVLFFLQCFSLHPAYFSWNCRKMRNLLFAHFDRLQVPPSATPSSEGAGEKYVQTASEDKGN